MSVTMQLLRVFRVDQQIRGLQSRLKTAQRFLDTQERQLNDLSTRHASLQSQIRQLSASAANIEGEANQLQLRIDSLREKMNTSRTNKEYQALLVEVNTLKIDKGKLDEEALGLMAKIEELRAEAAQLESQMSERKGIRSVAATERDQRSGEIQDRLTELQKQREAIVAQVPADALALYNERLRKFGDDDEGVMAAIELHDVRRHEFTCSACQTHLPVQTLNALLKGSLTRCASCQVILYIEEADAERLSAKQK
ncbi:MAG: hypothetical protein KIT24_11520 [Phycisphaeraceae bacterium]|nr:hypothetical protein [Phycisphaeraceae bacterium]